MHHCLDLPHKICRLSDNCFGEVILVDTNRVIKGPDLDFGVFIWFIWIWIFITENPVTNWVDYFSNNCIDFLEDAQFVSISSYLEIILKVSALLSS